MIISTTLFFLAAAQVEPFRPVFSCMLRRGKVDVRISGNSLELDYTAARARRAILVAGGKTLVHRFETRYTGAYEHLRFERGENNFVVYSRDANSQTGIGPLSGLVIFRKGERVADHTCQRPASFTWSSDDDALLRALLADSEDFSAL